MIKKCTKTVQNNYQSKSIFLAGLTSSWYLNTGEDIVYIFTCEDLIFTQQKKLIHGCRYDKKKMLLLSLN